MIPTSFLLMTCAYFFNAFHVFHLPFSPGGGVTLYPTRVKAHGTLMALELQEALRDRLQGETLPIQSGGINRSPHSSTYMYKLRSTTSVALSHQNHKVSGLRWTWDTLLGHTAWSGYKSKKVCHEVYPRELLMLWIDFLRFTQTTTKHDLCPGGKWDIWQQVELTTELPECFLFAWTSFMSYTQPLWYAGAKVQTIGGLGSVLGISTRVKRMRLEELEY